jgi:hypothetical protein
MEVPRKKSKPRKILFVEHIDQLLKLSGSQIKVWLYHYRKEGGGEERKSFVKQDTVCAATNLGRSAVSHARTWLVRNGWLRVVGYRPNGHGGNASVREYRCHFPAAGLGTGKPKGAESLGTGKPKAQAPESLRHRHSNAAEVDSVEVTVPIPPEPMPVEVFRSTNSSGKEEGKKEGKEESAPPPVSSGEPFENYLDHVNGNKLDEVGKLMAMMRKSWTSMESWDKTYDEAQWIVSMAREREFNPYAMLLHNRCHQKRDGKNGGLWLRDFPKWRVALESESQRMLEDYQRCLETPCEICIRNKHSDWTKLHPFLGVDGIHCECPKPSILALNWQCNACQTVNQDMLLVPSKARLQTECDEAESQRLEKLSEFDLRLATKEEIDGFKPLRDGWPEGAYQAKITDQKYADQVIHPAAWKHEHANAAVLFFLRLGKPVGWDAFSTLVEQIAALDKQTPMPETPTQGTLPAISIPTNRSALPAILECEFQGRGR